MMLKVYSVYDKAVGAFLLPFMARSHGEAKRMFVSSAREHFGHNARDYDLMYLSEFNDLTGEYGAPAEERLSLPLKIMSGPEVMAMLEKLASPKSLLENGGAVGSDVNVGVE